MVSGKSKWALFVFVIPTIRRLRPKNNGAARQRIKAGGLVSHASVITSIELAGPAGEITKCMCVCIRVLYRLSSRRRA